jgi:hypothetical protein
VGRLSGLSVHCEEGYAVSAMEFEGERSGVFGGDLEIVGQRDSFGDGLVII